MTDPVQHALNIAYEYGGFDGEHHKQWVIDQMVRALTECPMVKKESTDVKGVPYSYEVLGESEQYVEWVTKRKAGEDGPETYYWEEGVPP